MKFRGSLRWQPTDNIDVVFVADRSKSRNTGTNAKLRAIEPDDPSAGLLTGSRPVRRGPAGGPAPAPKRGRIPGSPTVQRCRSAASDPASRGSSSQRQHQHDRREFDCRHLVPGHGERRAPGAHLRRSAERRRVGLLAHDDRRFRHLHLSVDQRSPAPPGRAQRRPGRSAHELLLERRRYLVDGFSAGVPRVRDRPGGPAQVHRRVLDVLRESTNDAYQHSSPSRRWFRRNLSEVRSAP